MDALRPLYTWSDLNHFIRRTFPPPAALPTKARGRARALDSGTPSPGGRSRAGALPLRPSAGGAGQGTLSKTITRAMLQRNTLRLKDDELRRLGWTGAASDQPVLLIGPLSRGGRAGRSWQVELEFGGLGRDGRRGKTQSVAELAGRLRLQAGDVLHLRPARGGAVRGACCVVSASVTRRQEEEQVTELAGAGGGGGGLDSDPEEADEEEEVEEEHEPRRQPSQRGRAVEEGRSCFECLSRSRNGRSWHTCPATGRQWLCHPCFSRAARNQGHAQRHELGSAPGSRGRRHQRKSSAPRRVKSGGLLWGAADQPGGSGGGQRGGADTPAAPGADAAGKACANCGTTACRNFTRYRGHEGAYLCSNCQQYKYRTGKMRPPRCWTNAQGKRSARFAGLLSEAEEEEEVEGGAAVQQQQGRRRSQRHRRESAGHAQRGAVPRGAPQQAPAAAPAGDAPAAAPAAQFTGAAPALEAAPAAAAPAPAAADAAAAAAAAPQPAEPAQPSSPAAVGSGALLGWDSDWAQMYSRLVPMLTECGVVKADAQRFKLSLLRLELELRRSHFIEVQNLCASKDNVGMQEWVSLWLSDLAKH